MNHDKMQILIIEDETPIRDALKDSLEREGYGVLEAINGVDGLKVALEDHPDLILLDIVMPKLDGMSVLKALRKDDWGRHAHVILLTNILDDEDMESESTKYNVSTYLLKADLTLKDLIGRIQEELQLKEK